MNKQVTICVPTFNSEQTLAATLNSLLGQSYSNIKIIVFDNCSTDNTLGVVRELQRNHKNLEVIESAFNIGAEGNFTRCMQVSDSDYTAIFHADDIYLKDMIEEQVRILEKGQHVAVATHALTIDMNENVTGERFIPVELGGDEFSTLSFKKLLNLTFKYGNFITCPSVLIKSDILKNQIKRWKGAEYKTSADLDVWLRLSKIGDIAFIPKAFMKYRVAEASISFNLKKVRVARHDLFLVLDEYLDNASSEDKKGYEFLALKDSGLRLFNLLRSKNRTTYIPSLKPFRLTYFSLAFSSFFHLKILIKILIIWFITIPYVALRTFVK